MQILSEAQGEGKRGGDLKKKIVLDQIETVCDQKGPENFGDLLTTCDRHGKN